MYSYTIMPLDIDHVKEICNDIRHQYETGIASCALFSMSTVPEGNPPIDKAGIFGEKYKLFRDELRRHGQDCGILVQSSIGHGYALNHMFPFQPYIGITDGVARNTVCPYDPAFAAHFEDVMAHYASLEPMVIMLDDDFRLINRAGRGCACPLHMAQFNRRAGTNFTREELLAAMNGPSPEAAEYCRIFAEIQHDALLFSARAMRRGIDRVNPTLQGIFCLCGSDPAGEIARIMAGEGNPSILRVNNGCYTAYGPRNLTNSYIRAARQCGDKGNQVDVYLAETDTCPQNRYSTSASLLHSHYVGSILEGVSGAKHWITRLRTHEPKSGLAYRRQLAEYSGFYDALSAITKTITWSGCRIPLADESRYTPQGDGGLDNHFATCVLDRLGLPLYYGNLRAGSDSAVFLSGSMDMLSDDTIREYLRGPLFLASDTAKALIDRGFGAYIGVDVQSWSGPHIGAEQFCTTGRLANAQRGLHELIPTGEVEISSYACHLKDGKEFIRQFPAVTCFANTLGGQVVTFCGTPRASFNYMEAFSFLTESRKAQLVELLAKMGVLPVYYPDDAEVYLRAGTTPEGERIAAFFNFGLDYIEHITLCASSPIYHMEYLTSDGQRKAVDFSRDGDTYVLELDAPTLQPRILFLY